MKPLDAPSAFRMPISRVRCSTAMYIERQTTAKPMTTPMPMITLMNSRSAGILFDVEQRGELLHGSRSGSLRQRSASESSITTARVGRVVQLQVDLADLAGTAVELLQRLERQHDVRQLAALDDAGRRASRDSAA